MSGTGFDPDWLALREPADAAARAADLLVPLRDHLAARSAGPLVVRDVGCGTGSQGRWLAGRLAGRQHWILTDRDPALLARAAATAQGEAADGSPVTNQTQEGDLTGLRAGDLVGISLLTGSALLDLLTAGEVDRLAAACAAAGCPALFTLSVAGRVELDPPDPLDAGLTAAFNAHQRRRVSGRALLGPDAPDAAAGAFARHGATVHRRPSPWRLGPADSALTAAWLRGWCAAAVEQDPELADPSAGYLRRRLGQAAAGRLRVLVHHIDLLALPPVTPRAAG